MIKTPGMLKIDLKPGATFQMTSMQEPCARIVQHLTPRIGTELRLGKRDLPRRLISTLLSC